VHLLTNPSNCTSKAVSDSSDWGYGEYAGLPKQSKIRETPVYFALCRWSRLRGVQDVASLMVCSNAPEKLRSLQLGRETRAVCGFPGIPRGARSLLRLLSDAKLGLDLKAIAKVPQVAILTGALRLVQLFEKTYTHANVPISLPLSPLFVGARECSCGGSPPPMPQALPEIATPPETVGSIQLSEESLKRERFLFIGSLEVIVGQGGRGADTWEEAIPAVGIAT
jgi:hypothetical protein